MSQYRHPDVWPSLRSVHSELDQLDAALRTEGFQVERLSDPTGEELRRGVEAFLRRYGYERRHRLVLFFSGHGFTLDDGRRGYFVPKDAPDPQTDEAGFRATALSMQQVATWAGDMTAYHALFAFDSCFSGTIFQTREGNTRRPLSTLATLPVRQFISAGEANERVPARSDFVPAFIRALSGEADNDGDGFVTGTELGNWIQSTVSRYGRQTPQFGKLSSPEFERGEILFRSAPKRPPATEPKGGSTKMGRTLVDRQIQLRGGRVELVPLEVDAGAQIRIQLVHLAGQEVSFATVDKAQSESLRETTLKPGWASIRVLSRMSGSLHDNVDTGWVTIATNRILHVLLKTAKEDDSVDTVVNLRIFMR